MIHITDKKECCGCSACAQVCPAGCILMAPDEEGFLYPVVDESLCLYCSACEKVCPVLNAKVSGETVRQVSLALCNDDQLREASSSGGVFSLLADAVLEDGGVVYGAAFTETFSVSHIRVCSKDSLEPLRGSKYLQSRLETTFVDVKTDLEAGRKALFTGTACQISGLKRFLGGNNDNLLCVDVLCHGVPSPEVWNAYLREREVEAGSATKTVSFRSKTFGWKRFALRVEFQNGALYEVPFQSDPYMQLFLRNVILRPSCHDCLFKAAERDSDLTIGDAWGVEHIAPDMDDDRGTSVILVQTECGAQMIERISSKAQLLEGELDTLLPPSADSRKSVSPHRKRETIFKAFEQGKSIAFLAKKTEPSLFVKVKQLMRYAFDQ